MKCLLFLSLLVCVCSVFAKDESAVEVFTEIYKTKTWGIGSGGGSHPKNTLPYVSFLKKFLKNKKIRSVVDLGCGDWQFSQFIDWEGIDYIGYDAVNEVVEINKKKFGKIAQFVHADAIHSELPMADLLICKDVFQHLPNEEISRFMEQLQKFRYCLITNDVDSETFTSENVDIKMGESRPIDLTQPPFNLVGRKVLTFDTTSGVKQVLLIENF